MKKDQNKSTFNSTKFKESKNINLISYCIITTSLLFFVLMIWASLTKIKELSIAKGDIEPRGYIVNVQHYDGGIVNKVFVQEGEYVKKGQPLIELKDTGIEEELAKAKIAQFNLLLHANRIKTLLNGKDLDFSAFKDIEPLIKEKQIKLFSDEIKAKDYQRKVIQDQLDQQVYNYKMDVLKKETLEKQLPLAEQVYNLYVKSDEKGIISKIKLIEEKKNYLEISGKYNVLLKNINQLEKQIDEYKSKLASFDATYIDKQNDDLEKIEDQIMQNEEHIKGLELKKNRQFVFSEYDGIIKTVSVNATSQVINPGDTIIEIVPANRTVVANIKILPTDIGHVLVGDRARVKISSYDYTRYGFVNGTLYHISASTFTEKDGKSYYKGLIKLDANHIGADPKKNIIIPGMIVQAEIITGEKSIMAYLLKPIYIALTSSLSER